MSDHLPEELVLQVLYKLPPKSLIKCTSVCKSWNSLIRSTEFISAHLAQNLCSDTTNPLLLLRLLYRKERYSLHFDNEEFNEYMRLHNPFNAHIYFHVVGSCNGLICFLYEEVAFTDENKIILWNPSIRKFFAIPEPNIASNFYTRFEYDFIGFGFDSTTNDYKILRMLPRDSDGARRQRNLLLGSPCNCTSYVQREVIVEAEIYSLKANSWKFITDTAPHYEFNECDVPARVNGALYWIAHKRNETGCTNLVSVFDLKDEAFGEIMLPECLMNVPRLDLSIMAYGESSIAVAEIGWSSNTIWVMNIAGSWVKLSRGDRENLFTLGFRKNRELLVESIDGKLQSVELETQDVTDLKIEGCGCTYVDSYVESLVLLDIGNDT